MPVSAVIHEQPRAAASVTRIAMSADCAPRPGYFGRVAAPERVAMPFAAYRAAVAARTSPSYAPYIWKPGIETCEAHHGGRALSVGISKASMMTSP